MADSGIRQRLQLALRDALKARDTIAVSALRSALAAIDNASAVPPVSAPAPGTGGPHFAEREAAARAYDQSGHPDPAAPPLPPPRPMIMHRNGAMCPKLFAIMKAPTARRV